MDVKLYATAPTSLVSGQGQFVTLPPGYNTFTLDCGLLDRDEVSDLITVRKQVQLGDGAYVSETLVDAGELLNALPMSLCMTESVFNAVPGRHVSGLLPLVKGARVMEDTRSDILFAARLSSEGIPELCRLRCKYYSATIDILVSLGREGGLSNVYGILNTNVTITNIAGEPMIEYGTPIYFTIPCDMLLWNNHMVIAEEDGQKYWSHNGIPVVEQWRLAHTEPAD